MFIEELYHFPLEREQGFPKNQRVSERASERPIVTTNQTLNMQSCVPFAIDTDIGHSGHRADRQELCTHDDGRRIPITITILLPKNGTGNHFLFVVVVAVVEPHKQNQEGFEDAFHWKRKRGTGVCGFRVGSRWSVVAEDMGYSHQGLLRRKAFG